MKIELPTTIQVSINDVDLLTILKEKRIELLQGAECAEFNENTNNYWLIKKRMDEGEEVFFQWKEISQEHYHALDSISTSVYHIQLWLKSLDD
nr:hypothetical protein [Jeotgalibacillus malaysiensis]